MKSSMKIHLLIIDPQNDFCDQKGSLFVTGADKDMERLAKMIARIGKKLDDIHVTLDTHHFIDIAHPSFLVNSEGKHPNPFTIVTDKDLEDGIWSASLGGYIDENKNETYQSYLRRYVKTLDVNKRYPYCIWPPHCLIGSWGHNVYPVLYNELLNWEKSIAFVDYVTKGSNFLTEHYSAVKAEVPFSGDAGTQMNRNLIDTIQKADIILIAGEALSHCVANTIRDIANDFGEDNIKKFHLLEDATSNVTGFENLGTSFVNEMTKRGMQITNTVDFLS